MRISDWIQTCALPICFVIGAATPGAVIDEHEALKHAWPGIVEGMELIGSTQVQGRASLAGNLCNASPAADSVPALITARAVCIVAGPNGQREAPIETIATGPGKTSLARDEMIVAFRLPKRPRSEEHTSELQSLMRISYAVLCLEKKKQR